VGASAAEACTVNGYAGAPATVVQDIISGRCLAAICRASGSEPAVVDAQDTAISSGALWRGLGEHSTQVVIMRALRVRCCKREATL